MKRAAIAFIRFYRNYISILKLPSCRYYPTCSRYTEDAIVKYGLFKGLLKGAWRILRCNPLSRGGYDEA